MTRRFALPSGLISRTVLHGACTIVLSAGAIGASSATTAAKVLALSGSLGSTTFHSVAGTSIATSDGGAAGSLSKWWYSETSVPVGYKGSLISTGGGLKFNLGCGTTKWLYQPSLLCGNGAMMKTQFAVPLDAGAAPGIGFDIRNPGSSGLAELTVTDSTNQVLQYRFDPRSLERPSGTDSVNAYIPLVKTALYYGGSNDGVLHGPIKAMSVGIGQSGILTPADELDVDNVRLYGSSDFVYLLDPAASLVPGNFKPSYVGRLAVSAHQYLPASFAKAKEVGITVVRRDLKWADVETKGQYDFSNFDTWANGLANAGMSILWILDYGHPDHGGARPIAPVDRAAYAAFAGAAAQHYQGRNVTAFEVWNEPNYAQFWPAPDAVAYGTLLGETVDSIRAHDPNAKVVSGGVAIAGIKLATFLAQLGQTGRLAKVDGVSVHPYRATKPESFAADLAPIRNILASNGATAPVWVTEWGYGTCGYFDASAYGNCSDSRAQRYQGVLTLRQVLTQLSMDLPMMTLYDLVDDGVSSTDRELNFGLLSTDLSDKPAMTALRTLYAVAATRSFKGPLSNVPPVMHAVRWDGAADKVFALWVDTAGTTGSLALPPKTTSVVRWDGTPVPFTATPSQTSVTLSEPDGPVFVTVSN